MRTIMACVTLMALAVSPAGAQDNTTPAQGAAAPAQSAAAPAKAALTDAKIINSCGDALAKMFSRFGTPANLLAMRGDTPDDDDVLCDYGAYGFRVHNKVITVCFFWQQWKKTIRGIKIGDSRDAVVKLLGAAPITNKDASGAVTAYGYRLKDPDVKFWANFDASGNVNRVEIDLP